jgi:uncharacterized protein (DUF1499 family)
MQILSYIVGGLAVLAVLQFAALWIGARVTPRPANVNTGKLAPCPSSPNCVCTEDTDEQHHIEPIPFTGSASEAQATLLRILQDLPKTTIITQDAGFIYAESRSPMMSFVDDMDFVIDAEKKVIRFRSAARLGQSDLRKNRQRMELIREQFAQQPNERSRSDEALTV